MALVAPGDIARLVYRRIADAGERHRRGRLTIATSAARRATSKIYFLTPDHDAPAGGIRVIYRHVDILNKAGMPAFVLHHRAGFRCRWFDNDTNVTDLASVVILQSDLLVVPEIDIDLLARVGRGTRHVIFNQNSHLTWRRGEDVRHIYSPGPDMAGVVAVSRYNEEMLRHAFGGVPLYRIHLGIDPELFHPEEEERPRRIAYMPRRGRDDAMQVLALLRARGALRGWEIAPLDGLSHGEVAEELRKTRIFLAFTYQEGFGLPAAEAMACGNYVIGYHGQAGREFFRPEFSTPIESGDVLGFARAVEEALQREEREPGWCAARGAQAARFIRSNYSPAREEEDVVGIYCRLLALTR